MLLCEEALERDDPGFWTRKKHRGETPALRNAWAVPVNFRPDGPNE